MHNYDSATVTREGAMEWGREGGGREREREREREGGRESSHHAVSKDYSYHDYIISSNCQSLP